MVTLPTIKPGSSHPLGATVVADGTNFCIYSRQCTSVELLLFDQATDAQPSQIIKLNPNTNRTFNYWHCLVPNVGHGQLYAYRVSGPFDPAHGLRFDGRKVLVDPYAKRIETSTYNRTAAMRPGNNIAYCLKSVVIDTTRYDWEGDQPLKQPYSKSVIYELHVGGFTRHQSSGLKPNLQGTYAGLIEKIPYLKSLGITAVELLPVHHFDDQDVPAPLENYWGYNTIGFFAPHAAYSSDQTLDGPITEFRNMVKALHKAGIEVILDVVFNHTAEGNHTGPTLSMRGLANADYYILEQDPSKYTNFSGCGNTVNANHSVVRRLIMDSLRYWVTEMHVDGFRFDLASALSRDEYGHPLKNPPVLWEIETDPILAGTKVIAEAWDAAGLYQVGSFIGHRWAEWNGKFRDDIRRFVKGDAGTVPAVANCLMGSPDLYTEANRDPNRSINFVTCHDGFTLNDLVSYNHKHNAANNEDNRDGDNHNNSWNCGHEGPTDNQNINDLRQRQAKNLFTMLILSQGTPMVLMGDEVLRTQNGNNNTYCQNNPTAWLNWQLLETNSGMLSYFKHVTNWIQSLDVFAENRFLKSEGSTTKPNIVFHGVQLGQPDFGHNSHCLAFTLHHPARSEQLHIMANMFWEPMAFALPPLLAEEDEKWELVINTSQASPNDFLTPDRRTPVEDGYLTVPDRTIVVLFAKLKETAVK